MGLSIMLNKVKSAFTSFVDILAKIQTIRAEAFIKTGHRMW